MESSHSSRQNPSGLSSERRIVTIVFADISGFTSLAETMDPEAVRDLINASFEHLVPCIEKYGGTVEKFIGDEVMAFFGAPVAHENDAERAVRCALEMLQALAAFNAKRQTNLGMHIGINTGLVLAGAIGTREHQQYGVTGDTVNVASRLEDSADRGEILVGQDTYRLTSHLFAFEPVGPFRHKGRAQALPAYKLLGVRASQVGVKTLEARGIGSPLVGREAEVASLRRAVEKLQSGQGGVVAIIGEAGLGKSRLIAEIRQQMASPELLWLEGRALSFGHHISYWPFLEIFQSDAGITIEDSEPVRWAKLERRVRELFRDEGTEFLPYLGTLLCLEVREHLVDRVKYLDGEAMGRQVFRSVRRLITRLAEERPVVLIFEDMHWLDQSSVALLDHLLPLVREVPLLIYCVGRPDPETPALRLQEIASQDYAERYTEIVLAPLSAAESDQLVRNLVQLDELPSRLRTTILRTVEGNPFFMEEVIRALIDLGGLVRDRGSGRWEVTERAEELAIPDTVHGVIMARLDRLGEEVKEVLKLAAVVGRSFFYRVLGDISQAERELDRRLQELQELELIREKSRLPELEYIFKHALVHEATYESILLQKRKELHKRVGECIETLFADRLEEFHSFLAYHYTKAEEWAKAQEYLFKAGDQAGKIAADVEALAHYEQAMAAYARAFGDRWDPYERATLERKIGEALCRHGEHAEAREHLMRSLSLSGVQYPNSSLAARGLASTRIAFAVKVARGFSTHFVRRLPLFSGIGRSRRPRHVAEEQCRILLLMAGFMELVNDPDRALLAALLMLKIAEEYDLKEYVAQWYSVTGYTFSYLTPFPWLASHYLTRGAMLAEQSEMPAALGAAHMLLGLHKCFALGKSESAIENLRRATESAWQAGDLKLWALACATLTLVVRLQGDLAESLRLSLSVVKVAQDAGDRQSWGWGLMTLGMTQVSAGALEEAARNLQQAVTLLKGVPDYLFAIYGLGYLGRCLLRQGKLEEALSVLGESRALISKFNYKDIHCVGTWTALAQASLEGAEQASQSGKPSALNKSREACRTALQHGRLDLGEMVMAYRLQGTFEWLRGRPDPAIRWWQRSLALAQMLGARYELGMTHLEIGRRMGDFGHLKRAESIFTEIGAKLDLAAAQDLLRNR